MQLALDPGKTTGAVFFRPRRPGELVVLAYDQVPAEDMPHWLDEAINASAEPLQLVVYERFTIGGRTLKMSRQHAPLDVIGGVKFMTALAGVPTREQSASTAKTAYSDKQLRALDMFDRVEGKHARDALRHALLSTHTTRTV